MSRRTQTYQSRTEVFPSAASADQPQGFDASFNPLPPRQRTEVASVVSEFLFQAAPAAPSVFFSDISTSPLSSRIRRTPAYSTVRGGYVVQPNTQATGGGSTYVVPRRKRYNPNTIPETNFQPPPPPPPPTPPDGWRVVTARVAVRPIVGGAVVEARAFAPVVQAAPYGWQTVTADLIQRQQLPSTWSDMGPIAPMMLTWGWGVTAPGGFTGMPQPWTETLISPVGVPPPPPPPPPPAPSGWSVTSTEIIPQRRGVSYVSNRAGPILPPPAPLSGTSGGSTYKAPRLRRLDPGAVIEPRQVSPPPPPAPNGWTAFYPDTAPPRPSVPSLVAPIDRAIATPTALPNGWIVIQPDPYPPRPSASSVLSLVDRTVPPPPPPPSGWIAVHPDTFQPRPSVSSLAALVDRTAPVVQTQFGWQSYVTQVSPRRVLTVSSPIVLVPFTPTILTLGWMPVTTEVRLRAKRRVGVEIIPIVPATPVVTTPQGWAAIYTVPMIVTGKLRTISWVVEPGRRIRRGSRPKSKGWAVLPAQYGWTASPTE